MVCVGFVFGVACACVLLLLIIECVCLFMSYCVMLYAVRVFAGFNVCSCVLL